MSQRRSTRPQWRAGKGRLRGVRILVWVLAVFPLTAAASSYAYPRPQNVERIDISDKGTKVPGPFQVNDPPALSDGGRFVAFITERSLVASDLNTLPDVYVRDLKRQRTELITQSPHGLASVGPGPITSRHPAITPDGRYVAFASQATNLVPGDANGLEDVFMFDRRKKTMEMISFSRGKTTELGLECGGSFLGDCSWGPSLGANGRFVSFTSAAPLVEDDTNDAPDVFIRDRAKQTTIRVSLDHLGREVFPCREGLEGVLEDPTSALTPDCPLGALWLSSIDATGRYVAFESTAPDLVEGDTNGTWDIFVRDLERGTTERVSVASDGSEANHRPPPQPLQTQWGGSNFADLPGTAISAGGRYVVFSSIARNLVPNDSTGTALAAGPAFSPPGTDVFVHDRKTGRTERVSVSSSGGEVNRSEGFAQAAAISKDGRFISLPCYCYEVAAEEGGDAAPAPFVHDRRTGMLLPIEGSSGPEGSAWSADISPSGRYAGFAKHNYDSALVLQESSIWRTDLGEALGIGDWGGPPPETGVDEDDPICIEGTCIPPLASWSFRDDSHAVGEALTERAANLKGGAIAYRPMLGDLYVTLELEAMPRTPALAAATAGLVYGASFEVDGHSYEIRAASTGIGPSGETTAAFGLFSCSTWLGPCTELAELDGGFGTTGERITFSVPLGGLGVRSDPALSKVTAFTALGTFRGAPNRILDSLHI
ncbi:MAG: TolB family protein [Actinomycetota bacterium]